MERLRASIARLGLQRIRRQRKNAITACLALAVGFATAVSMFLVAFTQNKPTYCGLDREHTLQCYSNPQADVETKEEWKKGLPEFGEDEPLILRLVDVAKSQLGYRESSQNYEVKEDGELAGYTRYGAYTGNPYAEWNVLFANFCLANAGIDQEAFAPTKEEGEPQEDLEPEVDADALVEDLDEDAIDISKEEGQEDRIVWDDEAADEDAGFV